MRSTLGRTTRSVGLAVPFALVAAATAFPGRAQTLPATEAVLPAQAQGPAVAARRDPAFAAFVEALKVDARTAGVSEATFARAFAGIEPDRTLPDLILPGQTQPSGKQAEFTKTPLEYLNLPMLASLAAEGRGLAIRHADVLARIERDLGVDRTIVLAIWGRETAFGKYQLKHEPIRVLATLAYLGRRKELFRAELIAALRMMQDGVLDPKTMRSSWAGALGLTQFMPSEYHALALDFDGDGRKDIWRSVADALASAANQLKAKGWKAGQPWGIEIKGGPGLCLLEGITHARPVGDWSAQGVVRADGRPFDARLASEKAFVLTPGGAHGPAFLVFDNFLVLKAYNFADLYAVFVGHLADRIGGGGDFQARWSTPKIASAREIEDMQTQLKARGWPIEKIDGKAGMNTRNLIGQFQRASGQTVDCWPQTGVLTTLKRER